MYKRGRRFLKSRKFKNDQFVQTLFFEKPNETNATEWEQNEMQAISRLYLRNIY